MIVPPPRATIFGAIAAVSRNGALTLTANVSSNAASESSWVAPTGKTPALLTRMSTPAARSARAYTASGDLTAARRTSASPPPASIAATTSAPRASLRPLIRTRAPSRASASAVAPPMPEVPTVPRARCPLSSCIRSLLSRCWGRQSWPTGSHTIRALTRVETAISARCDDLTQHVERLVSRRKSRIGSYLEQCLTQLIHSPAEVQRAAQVRLELLVVSGGGEHRHHHQAP